MANKLFETETPRTKKNKKRLGERQRSSVFFDKRAA